MIIELAIPLVISALLLAEIPVGLENEAVDDPFAEPDDPVPAIVVTSACIGELPQGALYRIARIQLFPVSDTIICVLPKARIPNGPENRAEDPIPFTNPGVVVPAIVVRVEPFHARMQLFPVSAIKYIAEPEGVADTALGEERVAEATGPSVEPAVPVPTSVVTTPAVVTRRIILLFVSATIKVPYELPKRKDMPVGLLNDAAVCVPFANPAVPLPATTAKTGLVSDTG